MEILTWGKVISALSRLFKILDTYERLIDIENKKLKREKKKEEIRRLKIENERNLLKLEQEERKFLRSLDRPNLEYDLDDLLEVLSDRLRILSKKVKEVKITTIDGKEIIYREGKYQLEDNGNDDAD